MVITLILGILHKYLRLIVVDFYLVRLKLVILVFGIIRIIFGIGLLLRLF